MPKKTFRFRYSVKVHCSVLVDAETKEEVLKMWNNGDIETDLWEDMDDEDEKEFEYIEPAGILSKHFITDDNDEDNEDEE